LAVFPLYNQTSNASFLFLLLYFCPMRLFYHTIAVRHKYKTNRMTCMDVPRKKATSKQKIIRVKTKLTRLPRLSKHTRQTLIHASTHTCCQK
ncbi:hypothetical protein COCCADRAFT_85032, partial [Bipolaris zeicola 26-R-13]